MRRPTRRINITASLILTLLVLGSLISVPQAVAVSISIAGLSNGQNLIQGQSPLNFNVTITVPSNERIPIEQVIIVLDTQVLRFNPPGTFCSPCGGPFSNAIPQLVLLSPSQSLLFTPAAGYGYGNLQGSGFGYSSGGFGSGTGYGGTGTGFGNTSLRYQVTIFQSQLTPGFHSLRAQILTGLSPQSIFSSDLITFNVLPQGGGGGGIGPDFILGLITTAFNIAPGASPGASSTFTISSINAFSGTVTVTAVAPPTITIVVHGVQLNPGGGTHLMSISSGGSESMSFTVSASSSTSPGFYGASIQGVSGGITKILQIQINVIPSGGTALIASPNQVSAGGSVTFQAFGFQSGEAINMTVLLPPPLGTKIITPTSFTTNSLTNQVNSDGTWGALVTIPSNAPPGQYTFKAKGISSNKEAFTLLNVFGTTSDFLMQVSPGNLNIPAGSASQTATITITSLNSFNSAVTLQLFGVPPGVSGSFSSSTVTPPANGNSIVTLTITVSSSAPFGPAPLQIQGAASGVPTKFVSLQLYVPPPSGFNVPTLFLTPTYGTAGSTVTFQGNGFPSGTVIITFGGSIVTTVPSSISVSGGSFSGTFAVPSLGGGFYPVRATVGAAFAEAPFSIAGGTSSFQMEVSPSFLPPIQVGSTGTVTITISSVNSRSPIVNLMAFGLPPGITATFSNSTRQPSVGGSASATLTLAVGATTPAGPYSTYIEARSITGEVQRRRIEFGVMPSAGFLSGFGIGSLILSPSFGFSGTSISFSGGGFPSGETVSLTFGGTPVTLGSTVTVGSAGTFSGAFTLQSPLPTSPGMYPVVATSSVTSRNAFTNFNVIGSGATFQVSVSPSFLPPVSPGGTARTTISVSAVGASSPSVTLSSQGPPFITRTFSNTSFTVSTGTSATSNLTLAVDSFAPPGMYPVQVLVTSGGITQFAEVRVGVSPPSGFNLQFNVGSVSISPQFGGAGTSVSFTLGGFPASTSISMTLGSTTITLPGGTQTDSSGSFSGVFTIPSGTSPGTYPVHVTVGARFGDAPFTVVPSGNSFLMQVSPQFLPPTIQGQSTSATITVSSTGQFSDFVFLRAFGVPPGITVSFSTNPVRPPIGGSNSTTLTITAGSSTPPGPYPLTIAGRTPSGAESRAPLGFGVMPPLGFLSAQLSLSSYFGTVGQQITFSGVGFTNGATVTMNFAGTSITLPTITVSNNQIPSALFTVPSLSPGTYPVTVTAGVSDTKMFSIMGGQASFRLSVSPQYSPPILQGSSTVVSVSVSSVNVATPIIRLAIRGLPPGVTASFSNSTLQPSRGETSSANLTITVGSTTAPGGYPLTIEGRSGSEIQSTPFGFGVMPNIGGGLGFATLTINPSFGRAGDSISFAGTGYTASASISLSVASPGGTPQTIPLSSTLTVGSDGSWSISQNVPSGVAPGTYLITASDGTRSASAPFNVMPSTSGFFLNLSPQFLSLTQGSSSNVTVTMQSANSFTTAIRFRVDNLPPGLQVTFITANGSTVVGDFIGSGYFNKVIRTPVLITPTGGDALSIIARINATAGTFAGPAPIFIRAETTSDSRLAQLGVFIAHSSTFPIITITPGTGSAGSRITISGSNFGNAETVRIGMAGLTASTVPSTITTSAGGAFSAYFTVPSSLLPGVHPMNATGLTSGRSGFSPLVITPSGSNTFVVFVGPRMTAIPAGGNGNFTITINPVGSFSSAVTLSVDGLPAGASGTFTPSATVTPTVGTQTSVTLTVSVPSSASSGFRAILIRATAGSSVIAVQAGIRVVGSASTLDFNVLAAPTILTRPQGGSANVTITVTSFNGFTGNVAVSFPGIASGITPSATPTITPSSTTNIGSTNVTLAVSGSLSAGVYLVTVRGSATISGSPVLRDAFVQVAVLPSNVPRTPYDPGQVDPRYVTPSTPFQIRPPWGDRIDLRGLNSDVNAGVTVTTDRIHTSPSTLGTLPSGSSNASSSVTNIASTQGFSSVNATIRMSYDLTALTSSGISTSQLRLAFFNTATGQWQTVSTILNTTSGSVSANVSSFSSWTIIAVAAPAPAPAPGGGGGGGGGGAAVAPQFDFALFPSQTSISVNQGQSATTFISVSITQGSAESVSLSISGLPLGATASFSPQSGTPGFTSTLVITTSASTPLGTYMLTVTGTSRSITRTITLPLEVRAVPPAPFDFGISASPSRADVQIGRTTTFTISTSGLSGAGQQVTLSASGLPTNTIAAFNPSSGTPPFTSQLTISVGINAAPGTYRIAISASTLTGVTRSTTIELAVSEAPPVLVPFDFSLVLSASQANVIQGRPTAINVAILSLRGTPQTVGLSASVSPSGPTVTFAPQSGLPPFQSTMSVAVPATLAPGSYSITISGVGAGLTRTAVFTLVVAAAPVALPPAPPPVLPVVPLPPPPVVAPPVAPPVVPLPPPPVPPVAPPPVIPPAPVPPPPPPPAPPPAPAAPAPAGISTEIIIGVVVLIVVVGAAAVFLRGRGRRV